MIIEITFWGFFKVAISFIVGLVVGITIEERRL